MKDPISQLLRDADESVSPPPARSAAGIADAVRRRRRREQLRTRAVAAGCLLFAVIALGFTLRPRESQVGVVNRPSEATPETKVTLAQLDLDARLAEMTAQRLIAVETRRRTPQAAPINVQEQRDRTALVLIYEGDAYARGKRASEAVASYQRAIELFPQSRWADVARQRLKELDT